MIYSKNQCAEAQEMWQTLLETEQSHSLNYFLDGHVFYMSREIYNQFKSQNQNGFFIAELGINKIDKELLLILYPVDQSGNKIDQEEYLVLLYEPIKENTTFYNFDFSIEGIVLNEKEFLIEDFSKAESSRKSSGRNILNAQECVQQITDWRHFKQSWVATSKAIVQRFNVPMVDLSFEFIPTQVENVKIFFGLRDDAFLKTPVPNLITVANLNDVFKSYPLHHLLNIIAPATLGKDYEYEVPRDFTTPCPPFCLKP